MNLPNKILAVDFETSGLIPAYDHPLALSCVVFDNGEPTGEIFTRKIQMSDRGKISIEALSVQGANAKGMREALGEELMRIFPDDAITAKECLVELQEWTHSNGFNTLPCVAQKASFDWGFFEEKLLINRSVHVGNVLSPIWICTKTLACHVSPDKSKKDLNSLCAYLGVPKRESEKHDSYEDAVICGRVYFALKTLLENKTK